MLFRSDGSNGRLNMQAHVLAELAPVNHACKAWAGNCISLNMTNGAHRACCDVHMLFYEVHQLMMQVH